MHLFAEDVREALDEYLRYGHEQGFTRQSQLVAALDSYPDRPRLIKWIRGYGGDVSHGKETVCWATPSAAAADTQCVECVPKVWPQYAFSLVTELRCGVCKTVTSSRVTRSGWPCDSISQLASISVDFASPDR